MHGKKNCVSRKNIFDFVCKMPSVCSPRVQNTNNVLQLLFKLNVQYCYCFLLYKPVLTIPPLPLLRFDPVGSSCVCSHTCTPFYPHRSHYGNTLTDSCTSKIVSLSAFMVIICCWAQRRGKENWSQAALLCCGANLDDWP